ncbi:MAG: hypothetical protein AAFS07_11880 [Pseudomonadota bacterium]
MSNALKEVTGSTPFALLGAVGLLSLVSDFVGLADDVRALMEAWKAVTRPIWDVTLGPIFQWFGWPLPWWLKDYLTMGVIHAAMALRAKRALWRSGAKQAHAARPDAPARADLDDERAFVGLTKWLVILLWCLLWPYVLIAYLVSMARRGPIGYRAEEEARGTLDARRSRVLDGVLTMDIVYLSTLAYFVIILAANYVLLLAVQG